MTGTKIGFIEQLSKTSIPVESKLLQKAEETLMQSSLPTTRDEAWKYTRVAKLNKINFQSKSSTINSIENFIIDSNAHTFVFVNGEYRKDLSNQEELQGVSISSLRESDATLTSTLKIEDEVFNAVNTLFLNDGIQLIIDKKQVVDKPIQIIHLLDGAHTISNFKTIIDAKDFSEVEVIQGFFTTDNASECFSNISTEVNVGVNAKVSIDKIQFENDSTYHISTEEIRQSKDSNFTINTATLNGKLVRNNLHIEVDGENCETNLYGTYLLKGKQHIDNHTIVDHKVPNCNSNELYKGVIDDDATAVFNGKVFVRKDAQKINAFQSNGNVLLSDNGTVNSKPELEIYADDVKCSHGSTTGQLDEDAIFYLRARGLSEKSAYKLLVSAFVEEVLENIENDNVKSYIEDCLVSRFGWINQ